MASAVNESRSFDIIIAGAGLAGLSLLYRAMKTGVWRDQKILVLDVPDAERPEKTWSFWTKSPTPFDEVIEKRWKKLLVIGHDGNRIPLRLEGYTYNSIRSEDFYAFTLAFLSGFRNITFRDEQVIGMKTEVEGCSLQTASDLYTAKFIFNSIYRKPGLKAGEQYFLQHFKGVMIRTDTPMFNPDEASLMDFRTGQEHGTSFFYALPFRNNELFVEYTVFSKTLLEQETYDLKISEYVASILKIDRYEVIKTEYGVIPMTDHVFSRREGNIVNIGSAGGDTRGATGYTFANVQKTVGQILSSWSQTQTPFFKEENIGKKDLLYDGTLLSVLDKDEYKGHQIFEDLFKGTRADYIFSFLDAESTIFSDIRIIKSLRPMPFLKAMVAVLVRKIKV